MTDRFREEFMTPQLNEIRTVSTQKILNIIFIVDKSGSMSGSRMRAVNEAFDQMIPELRKVQEDCQSEFELRISIMTFETDAEWFALPTPILEYIHKKIPDDGAATYYSKAFRLLNDKLSRSGFMAHENKIAAPYIMFMTDGYPSSKDDYNAALDELEENAWFTNSQRFAVLIGDSAINNKEARAAVTRFVTDPEEGIIDAADAVTIASSVQAKTLHTVINMTRHKVDADTSANEKLKDHNSSVFTGFHPVNDTGNNQNSFPDDIFNYDSSVYSGDGDFF